MDSQRSIHLACLVGVAALLSTAGRAVAASEKGGPPNILFIMSDDHTWQALGCYNSRFR